MRTAQRMHTTKHALLAAERTALLRRGRRKNNSARPALRLHAYAVQGLSCAQLERSATLVRRWIQLAAVCIAVRNITREFVGAARRERERDRVASEPLFLHAPAAGVDDEESDRTFNVRRPLTALCGDKSRGA